MGVRHRVEFADALTGAARKPGQWSVTPRNLGSYRHRLHSLPMYEIDRVGIPRYEERLLYSRGNETTVFASWL